MILRLLNFLQGDLESYTVGDPHGINIFITRAKATLKDIRQELATNPPRDKDELKLINSRISTIEERLSKLEEAKDEFSSRLERALKPAPAEKEDSKEYDNRSVSAEEPAKLSPSSTTGRSKPDRPGELQSRRRQLSPMVHSGNKNGNHDVDGKRQNQRVVDDISEDLVHLARRLKHSNLAIQELVERDKKIVNEAGTNLTLNAGRFQTQHRELQKFSSKSWATTWRLIVLTALILVSIWLTFMLIIITRKNQ